ncbi:hypothetical protein [Kitasatospora sp. NBC_01302]|uniref:hypothetical protein n=1 Tax=Kitasatospora sp. NBC_01302 TaxID=2903575 RepID=UPI002E133AA3|nr:hypothetical protein OG294_14025 [Kitasatospora sp. NBC_01302]
MTDTTPPAEQGTHFWFMSLMKAIPGGGGFSTHDRSGTCSPRTGNTRLDMFTELHGWVEATWPELAGATVIAFDIQPNKI